MKRRLSAHANRLRATKIDAATGDWNDSKLENISVSLDPAPLPPPPPMYQAPPQPYPPPVPPAPAVTPADAAPPQTPSPVTPAGTGCQYDAQCKGERICMQGSCVDPPATTR